MVIQKIRCYFLGIVVCVGAIFPLVSKVSAQNLYVTDYGGYKGVYEIMSAGGQSNLVSGLSGPMALAFNRWGNLFVADTGNGNIIEVTSGGTPTTFASGLSSPYGLAFDNVGDLFEADFGSSRILEFTNHNGTLNPSPGVFASGLNGPVGLAFNKSNLFESDFTSGNIYEFTNYNGVLVSNLNVFVSGLIRPAGLAFNNSNVLFVANDAPVGGITAVGPNGSANAFASGLSAPLGLAFDTAGSLFVANQTANDVVKITPDGTQSIYFSGPGTNFPSGVAFPPAAQLCAFTTNEKIQVKVLCPSPYYPAILEASSDFVNWKAIATNTPPFAITNLITAMPHQYFRARICP
jgi:sugar lactone lactonase YvrE